MHKLQGLYVIADAACLSKDEIISKTEEVLHAGVRIIQYRDKINPISNQKKIAKQLRELTQQYESLFIVNDHIEVALSCNADGVHLGKDDASIKQARNQLGDEKIIGASCYASFENAGLAIRATADYIAFGSFFPSPTKPNAPRASITLLTKAKKEFSTPICAIGGISPENAHQMINAGADMIAVISAVFNASSPSRAVQEYLAIL